MLGSVVTGGLLVDGLATWGLIQGAGAPAPTPFHVYVLPRDTILAGAAFLPRETKLSTLGNPFANVDPRGTTIANLP